MARLCEKCRTNEAAVPDRNRMGRPIKRICVGCHAAMLRGDLVNVLLHHRMKKEKKWKEREDGEG